MEGSRRRKPLLIRGARQVGKSSAVRHLAKSFKYFVELNLERDKNLKKIFEGDLSPQRICMDLSVLVSTPYSTYEKVRIYPLYAVSEI